MKKENSSKKPVVGIGWYTQMQWHKLQRVAADPEILEESFEAWVEVFIKGCSMLEKAGIMAEKIPIDVDELVQWCEQNALVLDAEARSRFVADKLRKINNI